MGINSNDWYERLTPKERQVLESYSQEHSYEAVARALGKSESVVDQQLLSARRKMGVASTAEAMYRLAQHKAMLAGNQPDGPPICKRRCDSRLLPKRSELNNRPAWNRVAWGLGGFLVAGLTIAMLYPRPNHLSAIRSFAELEIAANGIGAEGDAAHRQAQLVARFAELAWEASYGPDEEDWVANARRWKARIEGSLKQLTAKESDTALRICGRLYRIAYLAKLDIEPQLSTSLSLATHRNTKDYVRALSAASYVHAGKEGVRLAERAMQIAAQLNDREGYYNAIRLRGFSRALVAEDPSFRDDYLVALKGFEALKMPRMIALTYYCLGMTKAYQTEKSVDWAVQAHRLFRKIGNRWGIESSQDVLEGTFHDRPFRPEWTEGRDEWIDSVQSDSAKFLARGDYKRAWQCTRKLIGIAVSKPWPNLLPQVAADAFVYVRDYGGSFSQKYSRQLAGAIAPQGEAYAYILSQAHWSPTQKGIVEATDREVQEGRRLGLRGVLQSILTTY